MPGAGQEQVCGWLQVPSKALATWRHDARRESSLPAAELMDVCPWQRRLTSLSIAM